MLQQSHINQIKATMSSTTYRKGDRIDVIRGSYKKYGKAIYLGACGKTQATVKVIGDSRDSRNLWLTSIRPRKNSKDGATNDTEIRLTKEEYASLLEEISALTMQLQGLEMKLKAKIN